MVVWFNILSIIYETVGEIVTILSNQQSITFHVIQQKHSPNDR